MTTFYTESHSHIDLLPDLWDVGSGNKNPQGSYANSFTSNTSTLWNSPTPTNAALAESYSYLNKIPSNNSLYSSDSDDLFRLDSYKQIASLLAPPAACSKPVETPIAQPQPQPSPAQAAAKLVQPAHSHHHKSKKNLNTQLYKTELCDSFVNAGYCPYGNKCQFAHGENELKVVDRPANWRSKPCANWAKYGSCRYGNRCCFKHA